MTLNPKRTVAKSKGAHRREPRSFGANERSGQPVLLIIAQRFNAGLPLYWTPKSPRGRQNRVCPMALLSSLNGLGHSYQSISQR